MSGAYNRKCDCKEIIHITNLKKGESRIVECPKCHRKYSIGWKPFLIHEK